MKRIVIITAALLVSAFGAQAASRHPAHRHAASNSACMAHQAKIAAIIESAPGGASAMQEVIQELRSHCLPQDHNPADYDPFNEFYVSPNN